MLAGLGLAPVAAQTGTTPQTTTTVFVLLAEETASPTSAQDLRARLLQAGYRLSADGPLGTNPGIWMSRSTPGYLTDASRVLRSGTAGVPVVGQYWTEAEADSVAGELELRGGIATTVVPVSAPVTAVPGTNGRYIEIRIPILQGQQVATNCSGRQEGVYVRDLEVAGDSPRSTMYLGVACAAEQGWNSQVRATSVDSATFSVFYVLHGDLRSQAFHEDPSPLYGHPAELQPGAREAVLNVFPKVDPSAIRVFAANGHGIAYVWTRTGSDSGRVKAYVVRHAGETWERVRELPETLTMSKAAFHAGPPAMSADNFGHDGQSEPFF